MLKNLRASLFLVHKAISRGNKSTLVLTILVITLAFINLTFFSATPLAFPDSISRWSNRRQQAGSDR